MAERVDPRSVLAEWDANPPVFLGGARARVLDVVEALREVLVPTDRAPDEWVVIDGIGGVVCSVCGMPTESEPCDKHQPEAYARCIGSTDPSPGGQR